MEPYKNTEFCSIETKIIINKQFYSKYTFFTNFLKLTDFFSWPTILTTELCISYN